MNTDGFLSWPAVRRSGVALVVAALTISSMSSAWAFPPPGDEGGGDSRSQSDDGDHKDNPPPQRADKQEGKHGARERKESLGHATVGAERDEERAQSDQKHDGRPPSPPLTPTGAAAAGLGVVDRVFGAGRLPWDENVAEMDTFIPIMPIAPTLPLHQLMHPGLPVEHLALQGVSATVRYPSVSAGVAVALAGLALMAYGYRTGSDACMSIGYMLFVVSGVICIAPNFGQDGFERRQRPR